MPARPVARWCFPADPAARARRDRVLSTAFALLALVLVVRATQKPVGVLVHNQEWGARFLARQDPYFDPEAGVRIHGPYPPSLALMAVPLACLPTLAARVVWAVLQLGGLWLFFRLFRRRLLLHWPELLAHAPMIFALALLLVSRFLLRDMAGGGGNLLYTALALAGVELALAGRAAAGALPLALSLVLKPNLCPLLLFLALRRRWRAAGWTVAVCALLFALPGLWFGPRAYADLTVRWAGDVLAYAQRDDLHAQALVPDGLPAAQNGMNQSLAEAVHRLLRPPGDSGAADVHLLLVAPQTATRLARGLGLALLLVTALQALRARGGYAEWIAALAFLPLALLLSPVTWKAHHVDLLPCMCALVALAAGDAHARRWLGPSLAFYWVVCDLLSEEVVGRTLRDRLQELSVVTWMDVVLLLVLLSCAGRPPGGR